MFCIPQVLYKENLGRATPTPITPEMERVKRNQEQISSVLSGRSKVAKTELKKKNNLSLLGFYLTL